MKKYLHQLLLFGFSFLFVQAANADKCFDGRQGDYRTVKSGNWNDISIWQRYDAGHWHSATRPPNNTDERIIFLAGDTVTIDASDIGDTIHADQVLLNEEAI